MSSIAIIIDRSGSMGSEGKLPAAMTDVCTFIQIMNPGDILGVVQFSTNAAVLYPPTGNAIPIAGTVQNDACAAVNGLTATSTTNINQAIDVGHGMIASSANPRGMVLLSDGQWNAGADPTTNPNTDIPIYTIALGSSFNSAFLQTIANRTGGQYNYAPDAFKLAEIYNDIISETQVAKRSANADYITPAYNFSTTPATIGTTSQAKFSLNWLNRSVPYVTGTPAAGQLTAALYDPAGNKSPVNASASGAGYAIFDVPSPTPGQWKVEVWNAVSGGVKTTVGAFEDANSASMALRVQGDAHAVGSAVVSNTGLSLDGNSVTKGVYQSWVERPLRSLSQTIDRYRPEIESTELAPAEIEDGEDPTLAKFRKFQTNRAPFEDVHPFVHEPVDVRGADTDNPEIVVKPTVPGAYTIRAIARAQDPRSGATFDRVRRTSFFAK